MVTRRLARRLGCSGPSADDRADLTPLILSLNRSLRGWANYFRHGVSKAVFSAVDYHAWGRLMCWIRGQTPTRNEIPPPPLLRQRAENSPRRVAFTGASSVPVTRYRGNTIPTPWTPKPATATTGS